jgi:hypothetical protein
MRGRIYTVVFDNVAVGTAAQDLFELTPADDKPVYLMGLSLDNVGGTADAGDAQEELIRITIIRGFTASGSGGSTPTPQPLNFADAAAGFAAEVNNTTVATTGTSTTLWAGGWNVRIPLREFWPEELMPQAGQGNTTIVVRSPNTLADAITCSGTLYVCEAG